MDHADIAVFVPVFPHFGETLEESLTEVICKDGTISVSRCFLIKFHVIQLLLGDTEENETPIPVPFTVEEFATAVYSWYMISTSVPFETVFDGKDLDVLIGDFDGDEISFSVETMIRVFDALEYREGLDVMTTAIASMISKVFPCGSEELDAVLGIEEE